MEEEEIIVTDILEEEVEQPELTGRAATMQSILANRDEEIRELEEGLVEKDEIEPEHIADTIEDEFVTVKVNGRTYEVEAEKVEKAGGVEAYQRNAAAHEKQREVADREAALKRREAELAEIERKLLNPDPPPATNEDGVFGKTFADQIFDDPEAVAETMNSLESRTRKAEETTAEVLQRLDRQEKKEQQAVVEYFWSNHETIAKDQEFTDALNVRLGVVAEENPGFTQQQVIDEAANRVYLKFNISREQQQQEETTKANRKPVRTPSRATSRKPPTPEVKTKTPDEIVRDQAKFRTPQRH